MKATPHPRQADRLEALHAYGVLDTPREADFDEIAELASQICGAPISVINLIDKDRQWFKAEVGLGVRETPLETSICSHVILEKDFVEIPDTLADARMQDNALCTGEPGLRFYAGALLTSPEGLPIGTLCVLDHAPRTLTPLQRDALRVLARQVMKQLDLRMALRQQEVLRQEIDHRVKNSLQTVSSLIRLQQSKVSDPGTHAALEAVRQRVQTIAALHEEIYLAGAAETVDLDTFMSRVARLLQRSAPDNVVIDHAFEPVPLDFRAASAVALVVNEFVANSFKHGFPAGRPGRVKVAGRRLADGQVQVECSDDGIGTLAGASGPEGGMGTRIIDALAGQLHGVVVRRASQKGVSLSLTFPVAPVAEIPT